MPGNLKKGTFSVYMHINKINGKKYIGITSLKPERRWRNNGDGYKTCTLFFKAIKKYGWENFKHIILYDGLTKEEACQKEQELISQYNTNNSEYGYNLLSGGQFFHHSEETKMKISEQKKGKSINYSEESRISHAQSIKDFWNNLSNEEKEKRMSHLREKPGMLGKRNLGKRVRKVKCVELNKIFDSISDAEEWLGHDRNCFAIGKVLNGKRKTTGGYHWEYIDEEEELNGKS